MWYFFFFFIILQQCQQSVLMCMCALLYWLYHFLFSWILLSCIFISLLSLILHEYVRVWVFLCCCCCYRQFCLFYSLSLSKLLPHSWWWWWWSSERASGILREYMYSVHLPIWCLCWVWSTIVAVTACANHEESILMMWAQPSLSFYVYVFNTINYSILFCSLTLLQLFLNFYLIHRTRLQAMRISSSCPSCVVKSRYRKQQNDLFQMNLLFFVLFIWMLNLFQRMSRLLENRSTGIRYIVFLTIKLVDLFYNIFSLIAFIFEEKSKHKYILTTIYSLWIIIQLV